MGKNQVIHRNEVLLLVTQKYKGFKKLMIIYQESRLCRIDKSLYVENLPRLNHEEINNLNRLLTSIFFLKSHIKEKLHVEIYLSRFKSTLIELKV